MTYEALFDIQAKLGVFSEMKEGDVYVRGFEEGGGCELFDDLQQYGSEEVDEKVKEMILKYWGTADQD